MPCGDELVSARLGAEVLCLDERAVDADLAVAALRGLGCSIASPHFRPPRSLQTATLDGAGVVAALSALAARGALAATALGMDARRAVLALVSRDAEALDAAALAALASLPVFDCDDGVARPLPGGDRFSTPAYELAAAPGATPLLLAPAPEAARRGGGVDLGFRRRFDSFS